MSATLLGGLPKNLNLTSSAEGGEYSLGAQSAMLIFRRRSGETRLYWNALDYRLDRNFFTLNGDSCTELLKLPAAVTQFWLRGEAELEVMIIQRAQ